MYDFYDNKIRQYCLNLFAKYIVYFSIIKNHELIKTINKSVSIAKQIQSNFAHKSHFLPISNC